jgi:cytochrome bd-type quinol oxidase subunit 2
VNPFKLLVVLVLLGIVVSLGSALYHLVHDRDGSPKMVRALTLRIALSVALFLLLFLAWWLGLIQPHGVQH